MAANLSPSENEFDGKVNHKKNITNFIKTCSNIGIERNQLMKQFMWSL